MNNYLDIILAPVITEKTANMEAEGKYAFKVANKANKTEIKSAIEKLFKVKVVDIKTINVHPRRKRVGRYAGLTNRKKKAIVTLEKGQTIELG